MGEFKIASLNLNGARDGMKRALLFETIKEKSIDVLFAQETHSDVNNAADWAKEFGGLSILSHKTNTSGGVAIIFSQNCIPSSYEVDECVKGRLLRVRAQFENSFFVFICVYAPTEGRERMLFLSTLDDVLKDCDPGDFLLLGGDYNCTELCIDRNHREPHMPSRKRLIEFINSHDLADVWRCLHNNHRQYTWAHAFDNTFSLARLDRFYSFKHQLSYFKSCLILPVGFSDHSMVLCTCYVSATRHKSAYWHFNTSLLSDNHFRDVFKFFWRDYKMKKSSFQSLQQWWDFGKAQIKQLCQQYTSHVTGDIARRMKLLEGEIMELQKIAETNGHHSHLESLKTKKTLLNDLLGVKAQGALVRSRFQSAELMDAPSKFFFNLEKKNGQRRLIHGLLSKNGNLLTSHGDVRKRAVEFYEELYRSEISYGEAPDSPFFTSLPKVSRQANQDLGRVITLDELDKALQSMECGKAPGIDGLPVAFYKSFWPEMGADLLAVLQDSLAEGRLPLTCRRAVLTLLPKKGDLKDMASWRPVSILCVDYRLLSKVLANRLCEVLGDIIEPDQTYCVPGRLIYDNISFIRDILEIGKLLNLNFGLVSVDQTKAFDRIEFNYLWGVLKAFGFNDDFINYIRALYSDCESILKINGDLCAPFKVLRGIRQGCPLSGMLYTLAIEPLLIQLRAKMQGVSLPDSAFSFKLSAYADDVAILVSSQRDVDIMVNVFNDFNRLSSSKVNWGKSVAFLVGKWPSGTPCLPGGLVWSRGGFKYLGVFLGDESFIQKNFEGTIDKIKGRLNRWNYLVKKLSYRGRVLIINNLVASSLWHRLACIDPPALFLSKVQSILVDFFWDGLHWVKQGVLFLPKDEGGQGLIHLQSRTAAFRLQFIQRLLDGAVDSCWKEVACAILRTFGGLGLDKTLFWMNSTLMDLRKLPVFYRNSFKVWNIMRVNRSVNEKSLFWLLQEPLVYGSLLDLTQERLIPSEVLLKAGLITLGDLLKLTGPLFGNAEVVAQHLGLRSIRIVTSFLLKLRSFFSEGSFLLMDQYKKDILFPNECDLMPCFHVSSGGSNVFPDAGGGSDEDDDDDDDDDVMFLGSNLASGKMLYRLCVKGLNKKCLEARVDTPWRAVLQVEQQVKPHWRALYKSPLTKRAGDLQWRILHGAIAVNSFISVINSDVGHDCPFCSQRETVFHAFMHCQRLESLFLCLRRLFGSFNEPFSMEVFIFGFKYTRKQKYKCQLLNFLIGQAKMAVYVSRRNRIEHDSGFDLDLVFSTLVRSRILIDFRFYKEMSDLDTFKDIWCQNNALCIIVDDVVQFTL